MLNDIFTRKLRQVLYMTDGTVPAAGGEARLLIARALIGSTLHDLRGLFGPEAIVDRTQAQVGEWREVDADYAYTVMLQVQLPYGQLASVLFQASAAATNLYPGYLALYGTKGTIH